MNGFREPNRVKSPLRICSEATGELRRAVGLHPPTAQGRQLGYSLLQVPPPVGVDSAWQFDIGIMCFIVAENCVTAIIERWLFRF